MIKMFCDVCGEEAAKNEASQMWPVTVQVDPGNGRPAKDVSMVVGIGMEAQGVGEVCPTCMVKAGHAALLAFQARA